MSDEEYVDLSDDGAGDGFQATPQFKTMKSELTETLAAQKAAGIKNPIATTAPAKKKKRKNRKKKSADAPTGFEAYYVEAPMTVEQAKEADKLYSPDLPITERIEICIQRYRAKRRWNPERVKLFDSYLVLGGIRTGQKAFGGGVSIEGRGEDGEDADAADIAVQTARDYVEHVSTSKRNTDDWKGQPGVFEDEDEEWWVDFDLITRAFLSHKVPFVMGYRKEEDLLMAVNIVRNFLNYVSFHNVAPEYSQNLREAISTCDKAEKELLFTNGFLKGLPGRFNTACSALFGGHFFGLYESDAASTWEGKPTSKILGVAYKDARTTYLGAVGKHGTPEQRALGVEGVKLLRKEPLGFEITKIDMPSVGAQGGKAALGPVEAKLWVPEGERLPRTNTKEIVLWLEKEILNYAYPGLRFDAVVYTLSNGLYFIDTVTAAYCSFYTYHEPPNQSDVKDDADGNEADADDNFD
ncbi:Argonaute complex, subunit Arb1 [Peziza echinospora]|nr:Argonaute complex, subunit Arb1 [Peziza echinospora]